MRKTVVAFTKLQAKYLLNKGKQICLPKRKKTQHNHSALPNCGDIITRDNEQNNSNSSYKRETAFQQRGKLNTQGLADLPPPQRTKPQRIRDARGLPNRPAQQPPPTQVFVTSEKNHKHLVASSSKNLSINSVSPRSLLLTRLNRPRSLRPHSGHIASSYSCENFLLR